MHDYRMAPATVDRGSLRNVAKIEKPSREVCHHDGLSGGRKERRAKKCGSNVLSLHGELSESGGMSEMIQESGVKV